MKIIIILCTLFFSVLASAKPLNKVVVFGDSLSDNGNLYEYMKQELPLSPPYYKGRFTNGPVWVELLLDLYYQKNGQTHLLDYAFGGAGIGDSSEADDDEDVLFTLHREIDSYLLSHQDKADDSSLYVVWMGSNNYLALPDNVDEVVSQVNAGIERELKRLMDKGAKHIMVVNVPDLGKTPAAKDFDAVELLTSLSAKHNITLKNLVSDLEQADPSVHWYYFDVNNIIDELLGEPQRFGLTNLTDTCYEEMVSAKSERSILKMVSSVKLRQKVDACTGYLFFDPVHPSEIAHQVMAERTKKMLDDAGIEFE